MHITPSSQFSVMVWMYGCRDTDLDSARKEVVHRIIQASVGLGNKFKYEKSLCELWYRPLSSAGC